MTLLLTSYCVIATSLANANSQPLALTPFDYEIISKKPHNPRSFTQGWVFQDDFFYESSGLYGRSFLQRYNDKSTKTIYLPKKYFVEGLTLFNQQLYLLTWKAEKLLLLDPTTLSIIGEKTYKGEGWGLTHNNTELIMSNGTDQLTFRDPNNFSIIRTLNVQLDKHFSPNKLQLNELEYVNGIIWANNWTSDRLYGIDSHTGCVIGLLDLTDLRQQSVKPNNKNVLNGIAYDSKHKGLWVTGKYWPTRYLITLPSLEVSTQVNCQ